MPDQETRPCMYGDGDVAAGERTEVLTSDGPKWAHPECHAFGTARRNPA